MKSDRTVAVAIVGGGFSGTMLAAQLARRGIASILIDGSGRAGKGVAYSTLEPAHLLNVRAEGMSAWAGEPGHFADRFAAEGGDRRDFAQRRFFGRYLGEILQEAIAGGRTTVSQASAVRAERMADGWKVQLDDGSATTARALVLAVGNQEPGSLGAFKDAGARYIANPWGEAARAAVAELVESGGTALLVGTGLTMVDLVLSLDAAGHRGRIVALSRRGQIPRAHADFDPAPVDPDELPSGGVRALTRWLRERAASVGWRAAVDSLRPYTQQLWQRFDTGEQRRFLRHARPWWDVHRHRIAPQVAATVARMIGEGRLEVVAGRIVSATPADGALDVAFRPRGAEAVRHEQVQFAFNCTGPLHAIARTRDPLLRSLLDSGAARPDALGMGVEVDPNSRVAGGERLWALGPLTKGRSWEIIAVPDIREQVAAVADDIEREVGQ